jgi:hypothetical protein
MIMIQEEAQGHLPAANRGARAQENAMASREQGEGLNPGLAVQAETPKRVQAVIEAHAVQILKERAAIEVPEAQIPRDREASGKQEKARIGVPVATE